MDSSDPLLSSNHMVSRQNSRKRMKIPSEVIALLCEPKIPSEPEATIEEELMDWNIGVGVDELVLENEVTSLFETLIIRPNNI